MKWVFCHVSIDLCVLHLAVYVNLTSSIRYSRQSVLVVLLRVKAKFSRSFFFIICGANGDGRFLRGQRSTKNLPKIINLEEKFATWCLKTREVLFEKTPLQTLKKAFLKLEKSSFIRNSQSNLGSLAVHNECEMRVLFPWSVDQVLFLEMGWSTWRLSFCFLNSENHP